MKPYEIQTLYRYNAWANNILINTASQLDQIQYMAKAATSHHSLHATLVHIFGAEWVWRSRCQDGISPTSMPATTEFPNLASFSARWIAEMEAMRLFVNSLDEQRLEQAIQYQNTRGLNFETPLWQILLHVVNHGTQFRSEAGMALSGLGHSPGDLDLLMFTRQNLA